jgi:hypothetical protein
MDAHRSFNPHLVEAACHIPIIEDLRTRQQIKRERVSGRADLIGSILNTAIMRRILAVGRNAREHELLFSRAADSAADGAGKAEGSSQAVS